MLQALWKVHDGPIFSICVMKDGGLVTGGGRDGRLILFDSSFCQTGKEAQLPEHLGSVRTISQGRTEFICETALTPFDKSIIKSLIINSNIVQVLVLSCWWGRQGTVS